MISTIAVLGAGTMGRGIAQSFAMHGYPVNLFDVQPGQLQAALEEIRVDQELLAEEDFVAPQSIPETLARIRCCDDLRQAVSDRDYVIEAAPEDVELKRKLFRELDGYCPEHTILASNASSLSLTAMMALVGEPRRRRMMVNHWYNPAHLTPIVELSCFGNTSQEVYGEVAALYQALRKQTVKVLKDVPGLVANRIQQGVAREVFSLIEQGIATPEDVDKALKFGPAFRYATTGQLEIADFGGLDVWCTVGDNLLKEMDNSQGANALLRQKVAEGKLGVKAGEGFYQYRAEEVPEIRRRFLKRLIHQLKASEYYV